MEGQSRKYYFLIPIVISQICAYAILFTDNGGIKFMDGVIIALIGVIAAIGGVIGTGVFNYMQLKRDGKTINQIENATSRMDPTVKNINDNTKDSRDILIKNINPTLNTLEKQQNAFDGKLDKIDYVVKEFEYQKRLKEQYSSGLNKDVIQGEIDAVYVRNAMLEQRVNEKEKTIAELAFQNKSLQKSNEVLQKEINRCNEELSRLQEDHTQDRGFSL